jgi:hypothetical protein
MKEKLERGEKREERNEKQNGEKYGGKPTEIKERSKSFQKREKN